MIPSLEQVPTHSRATLQRVFRTSPKNVIEMFRGQAISRADNAHIFGGERFACSHIPNHIDRSAEDFVCFLNLRPSRGAGPECGKG